MEPGKIPVQPFPPAATDPVPPPAPAPQPNWLHKVFLGPNGLRALWRLLIFVVIAVVLQVAIHWIFHIPQGIRVFGAKIVILQEGIVFGCVLAAALVMAHLEKRTLADYGLPARGAFGSRFFEGIVWGFLAECVTIGALYLTGNASFHGFEQRGTSALHYAVLWGVAFLLVGFFEEFLFRGYSQFTLGTGIGFWPTAFLLSGLFWLGHMGNPGETWIGGFATAMAALVFCVSLWQTGNLWFAIGMHAAWDWTETYFFGVADSGMPANGHLLNTSLTGSKWMTGGTVGPEGSVVELLVAVVAIALLFARFRRPAEERASRAHAAAS